MATKTEQLTQIEAEVIDVFVRMVQLVGLPKSIGEIYGLLYIAPVPLSMDQIMAKLLISLGTASQGLKQLRAFRAVRTVYVPGERKDYFEAETEFRKLAAGFFKEEVYPELENVEDRLRLLEIRLASESLDNADHYRKRIERLSRWQKLSQGLLKKIITFIKF